jgi:hypothetical protein
VVPGRGSAGHRQVSPGGRQLGGEPDPRPGGSAAREVAVDLAGDVALEDPDDVPLGPSFLHSAIEVCDSVPTSRPKGSSAAATCLSRWVSTPPVIPGAASTMVMAIPSFLSG